MYEYTGLNNEYCTSDNIKAQVDFIREDGSSWINNYFVMDKFEVFIGLSKMRYFR